MQYEHTAVGRGHPLIPTPELAHLLADPANWAFSIMTSAICDGDRLSFRRALTHFAAGRGLKAFFSPGTVCLAPTTTPITADDRGAVIGWLCARSEVHFVHIHRRASHTRSFILACAPRSIADQNAAPRVNGLSERLDGMPVDVDPTPDQPETGHAR